MSVSNGFIPRTWRFFLLGLLLIPFSSLACSPERPAEVPAFPTETTEAEAQIGSYSIELLFGPVQSMTGAGMSMTDQGNPVNQHLEIHIYSRGSGAAVLGASPAITIRNLASGETREFRDVRECVPPDDHGAGPHYGDNLHLPDGRYSITVTVGEESVVFEDIVVEGATTSSM